MVPKLIVITIKPSDLLNPDEWPLDAAIRLAKLVHSLPAGTALQMATQEGSPDFSDRKEIKFRLRVTLPAQQGLTSAASSLTG